MLAVTQLVLPVKPGGALVKHRFVAYSAEDTVVACTAVTDKAFGVVSTDVSAAEAALVKSVGVQMDGVALVEAAAAITLGAYVGPSLNGRAQTAVATQFIRGQALKAAANAGDLIPVLLQDLAHAAI